jgi:hypothetical protein
MDGTEASDLNRSTPRQWLNGDLEIDFDADLNAWARVTLVAQIDLAG